MTDTRTAKIAATITDFWPHRMNNAAAEHIRANFLKDMAAEVREVSEANGWFDDDRRPAEGLALIHSEVSEWLEALRRWGTADATPVLVGHAAELPEGVIPPKTEGAGSEAADVLIRLRDECDRQEIDLGAEFVRKLAHNRTRGYRHGGRAL